MAIRVMASFAIPVPTISGSPLVVHAPVFFAAARWLPIPYSWAYALVGVGILSAAIALLNLLPIPGLDGGHLLLAGSARMGWQLKRSQEGNLQRIGLRLVLFASLLSILYRFWVA